MNRPGATERISDAMVLALIGAIGGLLGLVWLWGGLAGALFGRGWLTANMAQLPLVLTRLPAHVTHPALAWPQPARLDLPGTFGCYSALGLMLAPLAVAGLLATRRPRPAAAWSGHGGARWAAASELRALRRRRLRGRGHGVRLALGRHHGRLLYAEHRHALVAFGPPQSGKSSGLAIPALLEWEGPVVASSIKTDLLAATLQCRARLGKTYIFDPFGLAGMPSHTWSPLGQARTWDGALEVAWRLAAAGQLDQHSVDNGDFWSIAAEQRLAPLLYVAAVSEAKIDDVVRWAYGQGTRELQDGLDRAAGQATTEAERADVRAAYDAIQAFQAQADRTRSSIEATAQALLRAYRFARVARSARTCEITADRLLDQAATLYLIGDAKASKLLRPLFVALLSEVVDRAYERATHAGGALPLPLLLCLDEAGNVAPLPNLAEVASTAPSHNIQLISVFHDLQQARSRYGRQAETVVNSHRARMLLPGVADLETLRYFAGLLGEEEARDYTRTTGDGGTSRSMARRRRPLVPAELLRQIRAGWALLLYGRIPPLELRLRMWFRDRRLRALAEP